MLHLLEQLLLLLSTLPIVKQIVLSLDAHAASL